MPVSCKFGTCVNEHHFVLSCQCDFGVSPSQFCEYKCCKDCGDHGKCYFHPQLNEELCNCDTNYSGSLCEMYDPPGKEDTKQSWTMPWIGATLGLCLLIVCVTAIACWCIQRKKRKMVPQVVLPNELQQPNSPQDVSPDDNNDDNSDHYNVMPVEGYDDNSDHYDVLPDEGNDDNNDHYDVFPDDGHDNFVVPYAVVPFDITEREATSLYPSLQLKDTYVLGRKAESATSYVLGRIAESETSVRTRFAVGEEIENTATSETKF